MDFKIITADKDIFTLTFGNIIVVKLKSLK